jgi:3-oxoacyl-[acyl-carrier protein] reductase
MGRRAATMFAEEGCNVAICTSRNEKGLNETAEDATRHGAKVFAGICDITDQDAVATFVKKVHSEFGGVDVVVNCATFRLEEDLLSESNDQWLKNIAVNLHGPYFLCKEAVPHMIERRWGRIINFSGISSYLGSYPGKSMVKLGIVGFTRGLAKKYGQYNITANCIGAGYIEVDREESQSEKGVYPHQPIRRGGTLDEVASLVVFMASENAGYITGQCYMINGGAYMQ